MIGLCIDLLIFWFVGKGDSTLFLILICLHATTYGVSVFLPASLQAEVIDYDELHTGRRREAQYAGFWSILYKLAAIPSAALPIALLASMGYMPNATQTPEVIFAIRALYTILPAVAVAAALVIVYWFPINADNHKVILEGIERHKHSESAIDPLTGREIPLPAGRHADEANGWFLDNFSQRELERFLARGPQGLMWDVRRAAGFSLAVCLLTAYVGWVRIASRVDPGALASLAVVIAGFTLSLFLFHLMRIGPARRLATGAIPYAAVRAHLEDCRQGRI
jgi:GPH family glycoside/pentoside/hexuronide:cation symporter